MSYSEYRQYPDFFFVLFCFSENRLWQSRGLTLQILDIGIFVVQGTHTPVPGVVLLLKEHSLLDMQAAKSTVTIQFSHLPHHRSSTSADKPLRTPGEVGAKSALRGVSLTLASLPVRHFNLISFPKLRAVARTPRDRTYSSWYRGEVNGRPKLQRPGTRINTKGQADWRVCQASPSQRPVSNYVINQGCGDGQVLN